MILDVNESAPTPWNDEDRYRFYPAHKLAFACKLFTVLSWILHRTL
jgi:hypothetical protein